MSTNIARVFSWSAARERDEMLELYDRKLSRTVLRRESGSNPADLAGTIAGGFSPAGDTAAVSYTHLRAHETRHDLVCRLLLEKKKIRTCRL